jgi:hypothetical protein
MNGSGGSVFALALAALLAGALVPAAGSASVPHYVTIISINPATPATTGTVRGTVGSARAFCRAHRAVTVLDAASGQPIGVDSTNRFGAWKIAAAPDHEIKARVTRKAGKHNGRKLVCRAAHAGPTDVTPPVMDVVSPQRNDVTGPAGSIIYTTGNAVSVQCTIDGPPVSCDSGVVNYNLGDGPHTFVITGTDADGNAAAASVMWNVDAAPPLVTSLSFTPTGAGEGEVDFTLSDTSLIVEIHCVLDGNDNVCGSGTSGQFAVATGNSHIEVYGVDEWGNSGQAFTATTTVPAPRISLDFTVG